MYDEIGISYKELRMVLARRPPREGMLRRPIVIGGLTVGSWKRTVTRSAALIEATLFTELSSSDASALRAVVERFGRFMELPATPEAARSRLDVGSVRRAPGSRSPGGSTNDKPTSPL